MKLKNFLYATMVACAFASCSNEETPIIDGGTESETPNALLSVKLETPVITKSGVSATSDATITDMTVFVFNETGALEIEQFLGTVPATQEVTEISVTAGQKSVVVVANTGDLDGITTLDALYAATREFGETEVNGTLSMNSRTYSVSIVAGTTNYLGYTATEATGGNYLIPASTTGGDLGGKAVKLYRNVAKINLKSIAVNASSTKYPNAKFTPTDIFVLHANKMTKLVGGAAPWASTEYTGEGQAWLGGPDAVAYTAWVETVKAWQAANPEGVLKKNYVETYTGEAVNTAWTRDAGVTFSEITSTPWAPESGIDYFYAYENTDATTHTLLVVEGQFLYGQMTTAPTRYYSISVGHDGIEGNIATAPEGAASRAENGVLRNLQYNIDLTVQGPGWETPFGPDGGENTSLDVKVEVVPFGQVNQNVDIE